MTSVSLIIGYNDFMKRRNNLLDGVCQFDPQPSKFHPAAFGYIACIYRAIIRCVRACGQAHYTGEFSPKSWPGDCCIPPKRATLE